MNSLLVYEVLGLRDFFTAVLPLVSVLDSDFGSGLAFASPAFLAAGARGRAGRGFASAAGAASAAAGADSGFSSAGAGRGASFFTVFAVPNSSAGAGAAAGWSPLAITSPLYTQHLTPITP